MYSNHLMQIDFLLIFLGQSAIFVVVHCSIFFNHNLNNACFVEATKE
jgi:hypothetical protein